jgi:hypothetical protein
MGDYLVELLGYSVLRCERVLPSARRLSRERVCDQPVPPRAPGGQNPDLIARLSRCIEVITVRGAAKWARTHEQRRSTENPAQTTPQTRTHVPKLRPCADSSAMSFA